MYCYPYLTGLNCVLTELILWANTAKEHQTFLMTVAELSDLTLSKEIEEKLVILHRRFQQIENFSRELQQKLAESGNYYQVKNQLIELLCEFLSINVEFLVILPTLKVLETVGNKSVWNVLVEHIEDEQRYMDNTFRYLLYQLYY